MISQKQNNFHWPEEETPSLDQEQTAPATSSWQGWSLWLRILGVVLALVGRFIFPFLAIPDETGWSFPLSVVLVGFVSAGLLRSWWSLLIVPVAFNMGFFLSNIFQGGFDLQQLAAGNFEGLDFLVFFAVFVDIGVAIGTPIGKMIEKRLRH